MQLTGKVISLLPPVTGTGKNGPWRKQEFILETEGAYPRKVCISSWGDRIDPNILQAGVQISVDIEIESREYNGRWYTDVRARAVEPALPTSPSSKTTIDKTEGDNVGEDQEDTPF